MLRASRAQHARLGRRVGRRALASGSSGGGGSSSSSSSSSGGVAAGSIQERQIPGLPPREAQVARLASGEELDVLIIGGGATGCGAALDAQMRGLRTGLIERGDFASETSSRSTKLVWAGIRYIATATSALLRLRNLSRPRAALDDFWGEFKMVLGAHRERRFLLEKQAHLTHWMPIAVPIKSWLAFPAPFGHPVFSLAPLVLPAVMKFYDSLGGFTCPHSHIMGHKRAKRKFPQLDGSFKYAQVFYEGMHNDARTNVAIALTAAEEGATVCNHVEMVELLHGGPEGASATGVRCRDNLTGAEFDVRSKSIIFAGGPFTDELRTLEDAEAAPAVAGAAGTHLVLPSYYCPNGMGMLDMNTSDGRFLFFLPWQGAVLVGTTDVKGKPVTSPRPPEQVSGPLGSLLFSILPFRPFSSVLAAEWPTPTPAAAAVRAGDRMDPERGENVPFARASRPTFRRALRLVRLATARLRPKRAPRGSDLTRPHHLDAAADRDDIHYGWEVDDLPRNGRGCACDAKNHSTVSDAEGTALQPHCTTNHGRPQAGSSRRDAYSVSLMLCRVLPPPIGGGPCGQAERFGAGA